MKKNEPLVYPVFLCDAAYDPEADCFFFGDRILACPVLDEGVTEISVRLPECGAGFRLRGEGDIMNGGAAATVPCAPSDEPVWFELV